MQLFTPNTILLLVATSSLMTAAVSAERATTCESSSNVHHLRCDNGVISVQAALYGRADRTTCSEGRPASQISNTACSQRGTVDFVRTRKLQLLAHQYLIPTKVEFHIGDTPPLASGPGFPGQLRRLGCVSLSDNENTGFKARELKSGHVDAIGTYLRITFHRNHINRYNKYNQVALIGFNVLGDTVDGREFNTVVSSSLTDCCVTSRGRHCAVIPLYCVSNWHLQIG